MWISFPSVLAVVVAAQVQRKRWSFWRPGKNTVFLSTLESIVYFDLMDPHQVLFISVSCCQHTLFYFLDHLQPPSTFLTVHLLSKTQDFFLSQDLLFYLHFHLGPFQKGAFLCYDAFLRLVLTYASPTLIAFFCVTNATQLEHLHQAKSFAIV